MKTVRENGKQDGIESLVVRSIQSLHSFHSCQTPISSHGRVSTKLDFHKLIRMKQLIFQLIALIKPVHKISGLTETERTVLNMEPICVSKPLLDNFSMRQLTMTKTNPIPLDTVAHNVVALRTTSGIWGLRC